jgi:hypothetical protein
MRHIMTHDTIMCVHCKTDTLRLADGCRGNSSIQPQLSPELLQKGTTTMPHNQGLTASCLRPLLAAGCSGYSCCITCLQHLMHGSDLYEQMHEQAYHKWHYRSAVTSVRTRGRIATHTICILSSLAVMKHRQGYGHCPEGALAGTQCNNNPAGVSTHKHHAHW